MVELGARGDLRRFAAVVDVRSRAFSSDLQEAIRVLSEAGHRPGSSTCTPATRCWSAGTSPTAGSPLQGNGTLTDGIGEERAR